MSVPGNAGTTGGSVGVGGDVHSPAVWNQGRGLPLHPGGEVIAHVTIYRTFTLGEMRRRNSVLAAWFLVLSKNDIRNDIIFIQQEGATESSRG
jgi:hypothetical protein